MTTCVRLSIPLPFEVNPLWDLRPNKLARDVRRFIPAHAADAGTTADGGRLAIRAMIPLRLNNLETNVWDTRPYCIAMTPGEALASSLSQLNQERLRALVQATSTFVWVADTHGEFTSPQSGWEQYTGRGFAEYGGSGWLQDVHPDDRSRVADVWNNAVRCRSWYEVEWRCWHAASRRFRWCITRGVPILNADGSVREWIGAVTDIEHELRPGQIFEREWLRTAQSAAGLALWEWDTASGEARVDPRALSVMRRNSRPQFERTRGLCSPRESRSDFRRTRRVRPVRAYGYDLPDSRPIGEIRWLRAKGGKVTAGGASRIVGALIDITDQVELQKKQRAQALELQVLIDAIPAFVWISRDPECRVITGNRMTHEFSGVPGGTNYSATPAPSEEAAAIQHFDLDGNEIPPDQLPMQRVCRSGVPLMNERIGIRFPGRERSTLLGNVVPPFEPSGKVRGCVAVFLDITELKRMEEQILRSNKEVMLANEQLSRFNFAASHDLREPMRVVAIYSELLERKLAGRMDPEAEEYLRICRGGALRMEELVRVLAAYTEITFHPQRPVYPVESREALDDARRNLAAIVEDAHAVIEAGELPAVMIDRPLLAQVFQNLISNAIKYRGANDPVIRISAAREGQFWTFSVEDNGIGIEPRVPPGNIRNVPAAAHAFGI